MKKTVVICFVAVLAFVLLPGPGENARSEGESAQSPFERWKAHKEQLRNEPALLAYYDFEGDEAYNLTNKATGAGIEGYVPEKLDGTLMNKTAWTQGRWPEKRALKFDGKDAYVSMNGSGSGSPLDITGSDFTVECWLRVDDSEAIWRGICGNYHSGTGGYMLVYTHNVQLYLGSQATATAGSSVPVGDGKWHHVVGVMDNHLISVYVDGVKSEQQVGAPKVLPSTYFFTIGRYGVENYFNGAVDEVAVYSRALTPEEVVKHYDAGRPDQPAPVAETAAESP